MTSIAQTNSGMRLIDMPGARCLKTVTMISTATTRAEISVRVIIWVQKSERLPGDILRAGEGHIGEPAAVGPDVESERDVEQEAADEVEVIAEGVEAREGDVARADHEGDQ